MILQIAHLTISTINFNDIIKNLTKLGYTTKLLEKNQKNLQIKKIFMTKFSSFHKLALLESDKNFNIEIVQYEEINMKEQTFLIPSFHNSLIDDNKFLNIGKNRIAVFFCKNDCGEIVEFIALNNK